MIVAKAVIPNQYWILKQDDRKVGNIEADPSGGFQVKINNQVERFKTIRTIKQRVAIDFEPVVKPRTRVTGNEVNGYPTTSKPYNAIYDVRHQVPLWTREERSKSWYAAGWYRVKQGRHWTIEECPKLIMLERYEYQGPFHTEAEARAHEPAHQ
jgi:hypothetical protein